jgi:peptidyl-prolyl cis-trans isomerase B (cyclophilin B)
VLAAEGADLLLDPLYVQVPRDLADQGQEAFRDRHAHFPLAGLSSCRGARRTRRTPDSPEEVWKVVPSRTIPGRILAVALALAAASALAAPAKKTPVPKKKEAKVTKPRDYSRTLAVLHTSQGDITVKFFFDKAPNHVRNFVDLAASGFYDGTLFHRVIPGFMIQGGDPLTKDPAKANLYGTGGNTDKQGNPVNVKAEFNDMTHRRGVLSMARATNPDSASSQFFVVVRDYPSLDRQYTAFGEVAKGIEIADKIVAESNPDLNDRSGGRPRNYQKIVKIDLVDESAGK